MADIKITFEEVKQKAEAVRTCNKALDEDLQTIRTKIKDLEAQWESDASITIRSKIDNMSTKFQEYYDVIESYAKFLDTTVQDYTDTESAINTNASQFE